MPRRRLLKLVSSILIYFKKIKRGISPLIATVLIIGFTVALGAVIIMWGGEFISDIQKSSDISAEKSQTCAATAIELTKSEQNTPNTLDFLLENLGNTEIEGLTIRVTGTTGIDSVEINQKIRLTTKEPFHINFDSSKTGIATKVEVIPKVSVSGQKKDCTPGVIYLTEEPKPENVGLWQNRLGNQVIDPWEECDRSANPQFPPKSDGSGLPVDCTDFGFAAGIITCTLEGTINTGACTAPNTCGNGILDTNEQCDNINGAQSYTGNVTDCATLATARGTSPMTGKIYCTNNCMIDTTQCTMTALLNCGNAAIDQYEQCDGTQLGTETCKTQGYFTGTLGCLDNCQFDKSRCLKPTFISTGAQYGCTIVSNGDVYCWGRNIYGELGDGTTTNRLTPTKTQMTAATMISAGAIVTCAINATGTYCWGWNNNGAVGDGTTTQRLTPTKTQMTAATQVVAGSNFACATNTSGMYCWGDNSLGSIGDGTTTNRYSPKKTFMTKPILIDAGQYSTCATNTSGLYCWGWNIYAQIGNGSQAYGYIPNEYPSKARIEGPITQLASGQFHVAASNSSGVYYWHNGNNGQLGNGSTGISMIPTKTFMTNSQMLSSGYGHICSVNSTGMYCWGYNGNGQFGTGGTSNINVVPIKNLMTKPIQISAGENYQTCALNATGIYCFGYNQNGQLGDGTTTDRTVPTLITAP